MVIQCAPIYKYSSWTISKCTCPYPRIGFFLPGPRVLNRAWTCLSRGHQDATCPTATCVQSEAQPPRTKRTWAQSEKLTADMPSSDLTRQSEEILGGYINPGFHCNHQFPAPVQHHPLHYSAYTAIRPISRRHVSTAESTFRCYHPTTRCADLQREEDGRLPPG